MTTTIIMLWISGTDPYTDPPDDILGPFTEREANWVANRLTCAHRVRKVNSILPEWATT
jgi:hypothetical protein